MNTETNEPGLADLLERGGVHRGISGETAREVLKGIIAAAPLPAALNRDRLLEAVLEREALMTTAIGGGIALPHPRSPLAPRAEDQLVLIAYLDKPVGWNALDGKPVHTVILIVSASAKLHLHTLSRVNFFCQQEDFTALLAGRAPPEALIHCVRAGEQTWN